MKILGIDPGLSCTGYGLLDDGLYLRHGVIRSYSKSKSGPQELGSRIQRIIEAMRALIREEVPDLCCIETLFFKRSAARSVILSAHLRGGLFLLLKEEGLPVRELTPAQVKLALTGNGRASKRQVQYMIQKLLSTPDGIPEDAADALAVAYSLYKQVTRDDRRPAG